MIILLTFSAAAQEKGTIKGFVRDAKTGEGMVAVNVKVKGTYY